MAQVFRHRKMNTAFGYFIGNVALVSVALVHLCPTLCLGGVIFPCLLQPDNPRGCLS